MVSFLSESLVFFLKALCFLPFNWYYTKVQKGQWREAPSQGSRNQSPRWDLRDIECALSPTAYPYIPIITCNLSAEAIYPIYHVHDLVACEGVRSSYPGSGHAAVILWYKGVVLYSIPPCGPQSQPKALHVTTVALLLLKRVPVQ